MGGQKWEVVGGGDKGGIVVRVGRHLSSAEHPSKLEKNSLVEEVARAGDRLKYRLLKGNGPEEGWVSVRLKEKVLLEPVNEAAPSSRAAHLQELRNEFPGCANLEIPAEAENWSDTELRNFFESSGFIKPRPVPSGGGPDGVSTGASPSPGPVPVDVGVQLTVPEALQLQERLLGAFKSADFQQKLLRLQKQYPQRKQRGHNDGKAYFEAFEVLVMTVYQRVLPAHGLRGDWDGVGEMFTRIMSAMKNTKVKKQHEEINTLLGLPRDAKLAPSRRQDLFVYCPGGDGGTPAFTLHVVEDEDLDEAHEFLVEEEDELQVMLASTKSWFLVKERALVRSAPDVKSRVLGERGVGQRVLGHKIVKDASGRWLQLHASELRKLGNVPEAWIHLGTGPELLVKQ
ncbi:unnamed protein product [Symbiodinium natans]|uniref:Uncharacterized protein n=1 Tax=Symbiodinium natans TaxID=878477 RepID=A0A812JP72_9DINO|nr:unnamed protein product [Symbiodinium natans]